MPELPEVETTRRGIAPLVEGRRVSGVTVREPRLRWEVPPEIGRELPGQRIDRVGRRAKYLLLESAAGTALLHLGMSGRLRLLRCGTPTERHDHYDIELESGWTLRFNDPRRFGSLLWTRGPTEKHPLLAGLGPEPLAAAFDADHLAGACRGRSLPIKLLLMNARVVAGIGNIYANEALHRAGIDPRRPAARIGRARLERLVGEVKGVLTEAIAQGGTTLRDFRHADGSAGYFRQDHRVYERSGRPCYGCGRTIRRIALGQRSTYFCSRCQR